MPTDRRATRLRETVIRRAARPTVSRGLLLAALVASCEPAATSPCLLANGGCSPNATCTANAENTAICQCNAGYFGTGTTCIQESTTADSGPSPDAGHQSGDDAGTAPNDHDAGMEPGGTDAGTELVGYCGACTTDSQCGDGGFCLQATATSPTYCGEPCGASNTCPAGSTCYAIMDTSGTTLGNNCFPTDGSCTAAPDAGPLDAGTGADDGGGPFVTIPLGGCPLVYFFAPVTVGSQTFQMAVDTGSTTTAVALSSCSNCDVTPELTAPAGTCGTTTFTSDYGGGMSAMGGWTADVCQGSVQVGGELPAVSMDFGGIVSQSSFFPTTDCNGNTADVEQGILGMGPLDLDGIGMNPVDAYFNELVQTSGIADEFAVQLCSSGGNLWLGGYDPSYASGSPQYTPLTMSDYWAVSILSIGLGTQDLGGADAMSIVDTGSQLFYMPTAAYNALVTSLEGNAAGTTIFGSGALGPTFWSQGANQTCVAAQGGQTAAEIDAALPPLTLTFPGATGGSFTISMPATQSYLVPWDGGYCAGVYDENGTSGIGFTDIGASALRAHITIFDEGDGLVGFVPQTNCQ